MLDKLSIWLASTLPSTEKGRKSQKYRGEKCLNCDHPLDKSDKFCPNCSQLNSTKKLHLKDLFNEFFGSLFAYDSRIVRTFKVLLFKPGIISKEYVAGKRMRYANPFRFYLSVSIIFFLLTGLFNKIAEYTQPTSNQSKSFNNSNIKTINSEDTDLELKNTLKQLNNPKVDSLISQKGVIKSETKNKLRYFSEAELDTMKFIKSVSSRVEVYSDFYTENKDLKPSEALVELNHIDSAKNRWIYKKVIDFDFFINNPDFAYSYFISKLPIVIFLFLPIFAFFIKLLYIRKKQYTYMEHLVFTFHVQSLFFVLFIFSLPFDFLFSTDLFSNSAVLIFIFYLYKAMRRFYEQGRFKTIVKFMILNTLFIILASFAGVGYALISFSVY